MTLKDDKQQNIQKQLDFSVAPAGEAQEACREETESSGAGNESEKPASTDRMMEAIWEWENLKESGRGGLPSWNRRGGCAEGADGVVDQLN